MEHLTEFFENFDLNKTIKINERFPLELHWSDYPALTKQLKSEMKSGKYSHQLNSLNAELEKLKNVPLWLNLDDSILKLSAFDLYHTLCMHFKNGDYEDQLFNSQEISFVSPAGPFKHLSLVECIHEKTLEAFLYKNILQNNLAQRSFRLKTKGSALLSFGQFHEESLRVNVEQLTENGILFSSDNYRLLEVIDDEQYFKVQMTTKHIGEYFNSESKFDASKEDLFFSNSLTESFRVNSTSLIKTLKYDSTDTGKFYLYCRYKDMQDNDHAKKYSEFISEYKATLKAA